MDNSFVVAVTESRIANGLLAVPRRYASALLPLDERDLQVLLEGAATYTPLRFVPATSTAKEARIYGLSGWYNKEGVEHGDLIEVVLLDQTRWLYEIWHGVRDEAPVIRDPNEGEAYAEGRVLLRLHRRKERNRQAVRRKKASAAGAGGKLLCEVCSFDFSEVYGRLGERFAECHHRTPLAELEGEHHVRLSDLAIVCANCHRMLHRRPGLTIKALQRIVQSRRDADA